MSLTEFKGYDLTKYNDFLSECSKKDYSNQITQKHHILPKFMGGCNENNLIILNCIDHFKAHEILAECFPKNTKWYKGNIFATLHITNWIEDFDKDILIDLGKKISEIKTGIPRSQETKDKMSKSHKGKTRSKEHCEKISLSMKEQYASGKRVVNFGDLNSPGNIAYKKKMSEQFKTQQNGKDNPFAKKIEHVESGKVFECLKDAMSEFGFTNYNILNRKIEKGIFRLLEERPPTHENLKYGKKSKQFLYLETGEVFKSRKEAIEQLPFTSYMFSKMCKEGKFKVLEK